MTREEVQQCIRNIEKGAQAEETLSVFFLEKLPGQLPSLDSIKEEDRVDIVHETLEIMLLALRKCEFRGESSLETFVRRIAKNLCLDRRTKAKRPKHGGDVLHVPLEEAEDTGELQGLLKLCPAEFSEKREQYDMLHQTIDMVLKDREEWAALKLTLKSFDRNEIASILKISLSRIDSKLHYARKKIRQHIQQHY